MKQLIKTNKQFPVNGDAHSGNMSDLLRNNIQKSSYLKDLSEMKSVDEVIQEIITNVTYTDPWVVGANGVPSSFFTCLYKLMLLRLTER